MEILPARRRAPGARRTATLLLASITLLALLATGSFAKRGAISISAADGVFAGTTVATVSGDGLASTVESNDSYWIRNQCFQGGERVLTQYVRPDAAGVAELTLGPTPLWSGGAAECVVEYGSFGRNGRWRALTSTGFSVSG